MHPAWMLSYARRANAHPGSPVADVFRRGAAGGRFLASRQARLPVAIAAPAPVYSKVLEYERVGAS